MHTNHGGSLVETARRQCDARGLRLTKGREELLALFADTRAPISAYDLLELLRNSRQGERVHPQTVYRALDFLREAGLVHRIASTGQFILCEHMSCSHPHRPSQFLVCRQCGAVKELELSADQLQSFTRQMEAQGFSALPNGLEVHGICSSCVPTQSAHHQH